MAPTGAKRALKPLQRQPSQRLPVGWRSTALALHFMTPSTLCFPAIPSFSKSASPPGRAVAGPLSRFACKPLPGGGRLRLDYGHLALSNVCSASNSTAKVGWAFRPTAGQSEPKRAALWWFMRRLASSGPATEWPPSMLAPAPTKPLQVGVRHGSQIPPLRTGLTDPCEVMCVFSLLNEYPMR